MAPPRGTCPFCIRPVLETDTAAFPVTGWEVERAQGGANRILGRERVPDTVAHESCVKAHVDGTADQTSFVFPT